MDMDQDQNKSNNQGDNPSVSADASNLSDMPDLTSNNDDMEDKGDADSDKSEEEIPNELLNEKLDIIMERLEKLDVDKEVGSKDKNSDTRIIIDSIELENFKSYANKKRLGPLHFRFNAVVGPNGSGKSNLMESLLFVFGKRAKKMRLHRLNELIHKSALKQKCRSAKVTVKFREIKDEGETFSYIPGEEFVLTREVFKNSSSKYTLNGEDKSFDHISKVLSKKGIDLKHNRFLILQGEVEQIAMMKQKASNPNETGLLEFLEDIIGTNRYVPLIEKLRVSIDELSEIKTSKVQRVKICQKELDELKSVKDTAVNYYQKEKRLLVWTHLRNMGNLQQALEEKETKKGEWTELKGKKETIEKDIKSKVDANTSFLIEFRKLKADQDAINQKKAELEKLAEQYDEDDKIKRGEIDDNNKQIEKIKKALEKLNKNYESTNEKISSAKVDNPKLKEQLDLLKEDYAKREDEISKAEKDAFQKTEGLQKEKKELSKKLQPSETQINANNFKIESNKKTIDVMSQSLSKLEKEIETIEQDKESLNEARKERQEAYDDLSQKKEELEDQKKEFEKQKISKTQELDQKNKEVQNYLSMLSDMKAASSDRSNKDVVLEALLKAQQEGKLTGILGKLGHLGTINEKYDCAITTACKHLDGILVETVEQTKAALNYIKKNQIGQATFIILEKIKWVEPNMKRNFICPNGCQRLYDLVNRNNDPKLDIAFYFALRDTLVTDSIQRAKQVAYGNQRQRIVTLNGELFEIYGTVSGGGKPKRGGMSNKKSAVNIEEEIRKTNQLYDQCAKEYDLIKTELTKAENGYNKANANLQQLLVAFNKVETELGNIDKQMKTFETNLEKANKELQKLNKEKKTIENLTDENERLEKENENLTADSKNLREQLADIENKINSIMGKDYHKKKQELSEAKKKITELNKEYSSNEELLKSANETLAKLKKDMETKEKQKETCTAKIEECKKFLTDLETKALSTYSEIEECDKKKTELVEKFNEKNSEIEKLKKVIKEMKAESEKVEEQIKEKEEELKKCDRNININKEKVNANIRSFQKLIADFGFVDDIEDDIKKINEDIGKPKEDKKDEEGKDNPSSHSDDMDIDDDPNKKKDSPKKDPKKDDSSVVDDNPSDDDSDKKDEGASKKQKDTELTKLMNKYFELKDLQTNIPEEEMKILKAKIKQLSYEVTLIETELNNEKPDMSAIAKYKETLINLKEKKADLSQTVEKLNKANEIFAGVKMRRYNEFMEGFTIISTKLKEMYQLITAGGDAELELVDTLDPFSEGVSFSVRPYKKSWKTITNLSGGEKTLSSLSLIFALHHYKPSPLYVMDEIDAALDFRNVSIIANYIKKETMNSQFIIISLRNQMFDLANNMIGIYKTHDITKCLSFEPAKVEMHLKEGEDVDMNGDNRGSQRKNDQDGGQGQGQRNQGGNFSSAKK
ncbi:MAG: chromosome segregation protein SMC [archaeon]|nr:chromosome segregation protein SMC [archaeon]